MSEIAFTPWLPVAVIAALAIIGVVAALASLRRSIVGGILRLLVVILGTVFLLNPERREFEGDLLPDIAVILEDVSRSLSFGDRTDIAVAAADRLEGDLAAQGLEVRRVGFGSTIDTPLTDALAVGLADVPRGRLSAVFAVTDGQIHDQPSPPTDVPFHAVLAGDPATQRDRRVEIIRSPQFGVVGDQVELTFMIHATDESGFLPSTLYLNGDVYAQEDAPVGEPITLTVTLIQPGETILELEVEEAVGELNFFEQSRCRGSHCRARSPPCPVGFRRTPCGRASVAQSS